MPPLHMTCTYEFPCPSLFESLVKTLRIPIKSHRVNSMELVIPLDSLYWSIHTKDESKRGTAFAFIFGVNWLWRCGVIASFGVFFHHIKCNGMTSFMEFNDLQSPRRPGVPVRTEETSGIRHSLHVAQSHYLLFVSGKEEGKILDMKLFELYRGHNY